MRIKEAIVNNFMEIREKEGKKGKIKKILIQNHKNHSKHHVKRND